MAFLPLVFDDELIGGVYIDRSVDMAYFRQPELDLLVAFGPVAGLTVQELRRDSVRSENRELRRRLARQSGFEGIVTQNRQMLEILSLVERLRDSRTTVLLQGETGTGKELLANAIHSVSTRAERPLVAVNCAARSQDRARE